jgi:uncharacterized heparinase superfamily protein
MSFVLASSLPPPVMVMNAGSPSGDLMARMRTRLQTLAYSSHLYRMMISGPVPRTLAVVPTDPWPGDAARGQELVDGVFACAGQRFSAHPPGWLPEKANLGWLLYAHGFDWLRDLRALGGDTARRTARSLLASWCDVFEAWAPFVWEAPLVATRITHLIAFHDFVLESADTPFRIRIFENLVRHSRHLQRILPGAAGAEEEGLNVQLPPPGQLCGSELLIALRGLVFAGVALPDEDKALKMALEIMPSLLAAALTADGMTAERNPGRQMDALRALIDMRQALKAGKVALPPELPMAIERASAALRLLRHGDGSLALFNGSLEENPVLLDALLTQSETRARTPKTLPQGGYERLVAGRMLVIADVSSPPSAGCDRAAHAGATSFECSIGKERLIVNCGAHPGRDEPAWVQALASTAAHSTLTVNNTNSCDVPLPGQVLARRPHRVALARDQEQGKQILEISHDGYLARARLMHHRRFVLSENGDELTGEDVLYGAGGQNFALRFHLHPLVQESLIQQGGAVLLRLPSGIGFRFRAGGHALAIEESLYYGKTTGRRSRQIVLYGQTQEGRTLVEWAFAREKRG